MNNQLKGERENFQFKRKFLRFLIHLVGESERNINDVFEDILFSEERIIEESYRQGYSEGACEYTVEGYHLGYHRGAEIGSKLGYYKAFCEYNLCKPEIKRIPEKTVKHLEQLQQHIDVFPHDNCEHVDLFESFEQIEALYKKICTQLKVKKDFKKEGLQF